MMTKIELIKNYTIDELANMVLRKDEEIKQIDCALQKHLGIKHNDVDTPDEFECLLKNAINKPISKNTNIYGGCVVSTYYPKDDGIYVKSSDYDSVLYELKRAKDKIYQDSIKNATESTKKLSDAVKEKGEEILPHEPIDVASMLINAMYTRKKGDWEKAIHKAFGNNSETITENIYSVNDLKEIAEHLLAYCNNNVEEEL